MNAVSYCVAIWSAFSFLKVVHAGVSWVWLERLVLVCGHCWRKCPCVSSSRAL